MLEVEGVVVEDDYQRSKADMGKTLLRIEKLNGNKLREEVVLSLATFSFTETDKPKPGSRFNYLGHQTGQMEGIPEDAFKVMPLVTTRGYHLYVHFQACKDLSAQASE